MRKSVAVIAMSVIILICMATDISAQEKLKVNLSGCILLDGISFMNNRTTMTGKNGIPDLRLVEKATYDNWYGKLNIGFAGNKVSVKDAYLQYWKSQDWCRRSVECE